MDFRPVGIFDSGMGGLTSVRELRRLLPGEDIAYLGDTARVPYGGRSVEELRRIAESDVRFLRGRGVKAMLVACGTVSSNCLDYVQEKAGVPALGVVKPTAREAAEATENGRIGVLSTVATQRSGAFVRELKALEPAWRCSPPAVRSWCRWWRPAGRTRRTRRSLRRFPNALRG